MHKNIFFRSVWSDDCEIYIHICMQNFILNPIWIYPTENIHLDTQRHLWEFFGTERIHMFETQTRWNALLSCSTRSKHTHQKAFFPLPNNFIIPSQWAAVDSISLIFSIFWNFCLNEKKILFSFYCGTFFYVATQNTTAEVIHLLWC